MPLDRISPAMARAVIGAEDSTFCCHHGFDVAAIEQAAARNAASRKLRGGSTISQQTAKNAFLWPGRSYLRKGLEAYFTVLIEALWGKPRIMEVYLNIAELGPGIYGVEAAAHRYFDTTAARLTPAQAARIAAILPQPDQARRRRPPRHRPPPCPRHRAPDRRRPPRRDRRLPRRLKPARAPNPSNAQRDEQQFCALARSLSQ